MSTLTVTMTCSRCTTITTTDTGDSRDHASINQPIPNNQANSVCASCNKTYDAHGRPVNKRAAANKVRQARAENYRVLLTAILEGIRGKGQKGGTNGVGKERPGVGGYTVLERVLDAMGGVVKGA